MAKNSKKTCKLVTAEIIALQGLLSLFKVPIRFYTEYGIEGNSLDSIGKPEILAGDSVGERAIVGLFEIVQADSIHLLTLFDFHGYHVHPVL